MPETPLPDPDLVRAARRRLTSRFATGVEAVLWEMHKHPMHDLDAVTRVVRDRTEQSGSAPPDGVTALDIGAAFLVLMAARLDADRLEAVLFERALAIGMEYEHIAAVLDLPDARAARRRHEEMRSRARTPTADAPSPLDEETVQRRARGRAARHRAAEAGARAEHAAAQQSAHRIPGQDERPGQAGEGAVEQPAEQSVGHSVEQAAAQAVEQDIEQDIELAAERAAQARERAVAASQSAVRAHEEAARRHLSAAAAGQGDIALHRRMADHHRRAAEAHRALAAPFTSGSGDETDEDEEGFDGGTGGKAQ